MRSRSCARIGVQFSELTSASNPAASRAHMVVNIASLPSTVTFVVGASRNPRRDRGLFGGAGACAGCCPCPAGRVCPQDGQGSIAADKTPNAIQRKNLVMEFGAAPG